ncbi:MAG: hypothetical protein NW226_07815 [Microscillaceae bacterium]|nr:hypothetical protein [Microscillaceae bacterium]
MELLYQSNYFTISYDLDNRLFHYIFNENTSLMTDEEYVGELKVFTDFVSLHKPKKVLGDMIDFKFTISPEIQEWVNDNLFKVYREIDFEKIAILLSREYIASLSIEQTMEEDKTNSFKSRYFDDINAARKWLLRDN